MGHTTPREVFCLLLVARRESQSSILTHIHGGYRAQLAKNLLIRIRRLRTILAYFVVTVVIETLEGGLSVLVTLAGDFLLGLLLSFDLLLGGFLCTLISL